MLKNASYHKRSISKRITFFSAILIIGILLGLVIDEPEANRINPAKKISPFDNADNRTLRSGKILRSGINTLLSNDNLILENKKTEESLQMPEESGIKSLQLAIKDMINTCGLNYPKGETYLKEIDKQLDLYQKAKDNQTKAKAACALFRIRREALLTNPLVINHPVLFVVRKQYARDHHNTHTAFPIGKYDYNGPQGTGPSKNNQFAQGGALKMIDLKNGNKIFTLIETLEGVIRDPDVHWDGTKIIFSWKKSCKDSYHIYEINVNGTGLKQLTFLKDIDDLDPIYLPDNRIVFSSSRELKYVPCNRHRQFNIYCMDADGANIHQITKNNIYDKPSCITPDGRILYDRWEYIDRDSHNAQSLWTVNPDGTNQSLFWGNNTETPDGVIDTRMIPGTQKFLTVFASLHDRPRGILAMIDRRQGIDGHAPVIRTWPADGINLIRGETNNDNADMIMLKHVTPVYEDPFPLSDKYFLVSRMTNHNESGYPPGESIYLVDVFGNEILIHKETPGCFDPIPVTSRKRPIIRPALRDFENKEGRFYVQDVYTGLSGIPKGTVKFLRVVEAPEKRYWASGSLPWYNYSTTYPGISWHNFETKRILGTVPVEEDGSAYFEVPSDKFVYFQLLDDKGMMVQSMRSGTVVQSGEVTGCVGCHENRLSSPVNRGNLVLQAMNKAPEKLNEWYGDTREFNYMAEVQPVFDKHCVKCHDFGSEPGKKLNLARDRNVIFNTSYNELWRKRYIVVTGAGSTKIPSPKSWGSHASPLIKTLLKGHQGIKLSKEEFERIVTWIDLNAVFYGSFASAYPENRGGRSPLTPAEEDSLSKLTGVNVAKQYAHYSNKGPLVSFDRPAISPILSGLQTGDINYKKALSIIERGKERLTKKPDSDTSGFKISDPADQWHEDMYRYLRWIEMRNRKAISEGEKLYDTDQPTFDEWGKKIF